MLHDVSPGAPRFGCAVDGVHVAAGVVQVALLAGNDSLGFFGAEPAREQRVGSQRAMNGQLLLELRFDPRSAAPRQLEGTALTIVWAAVHAGSSTRNTASAYRRQSAVFALKRARPCGVSL